MSLSTMAHDPAHDDAHGAEHDAGSHHDDHAHDFDPEPVRTLPDDEPRTPSWVPLLGAAIFLVGGTWFLMGSSDDGEPPAAVPEAPAAAVGARPIPPASDDQLVAPQPRRPAAAPPGGAPGAPAEGDAKPRPLNRPPQTAEERARFVEQLRKARAEADAAGARAPAAPAPAAPAAPDPHAGHNHP
jgi:hypothetical protein